MYISSFQIENYKGFLRSEELVFKPGFNVIVGQNNVGKTALVEALSLNFHNKPHRSIKTIPTPNSPTIAQSIAKISFTILPEELRNILTNRLNTFYIPLPENRNMETGISNFEAILNKTNTIECIFTEGVFSQVSLEEYGPLGSRDINVHAALIKSNKEQQLLIPEKTFYSSTRRSLFDFAIANMLREGIYLFKAERLNIGEYTFGTSSNLSSNASNLPEVLNVLQGNVSRFRRFNELVNVIFPDIRHISVQPGPGNSQVQILVWTIDPSTERIDLATPLLESGTGIGQVLSILYVILTSEYPRTIIIDEPQSFLHPGAARKLIEILKQYSQHQFIITTHSPTAVTAANPSTLLLVRKNEAESITELLNVSEAQQLRVFLSEIGARLSDIFGADNILWVEGRTEELCFPMILEGIAKRSLLGTQIIGVRQTGDFEGKHSKTTFEIYTRLSEGRGLLPPAIGFIFDREGRSEKEQADLVRQSNNTVHFLQRRMYENYLLNSEAISSVVSAIEGFRDIAITSEEIEQWLELHRWDKRYIGNVDPSTKDITLWIKTVHGARILEDLFKELSENRINYDKIAHGVLLTTWIIEHTPLDLEEVGKMLKNILSQDNTM